MQFIGKFVSVLRRVLEAAQFAMFIWKGKTQGNYIYSFTMNICVHVLKPNWFLTCVLAATNFQLKNDAYLRGICDLAGVFKAVFFLENGSPIFWKP